jgi:hypothetical protein
MRVIDPAAFIMTRRMLCLGEGRAEAPRRAEVPLGAAISRPDPPFEQRRGPGPYGGLLTLCRLGRA